MRVGGGEYVDENSILCRALLPKSLTPHVVYPEAYRWGVAREQKSVESGKS